MYFNDHNEKIVFVGSPADTGMFRCKLAGVTYPNPEYRMTRCPAQEYVFEYVISGSGYLETSGSVTHVTSGTFYLYKKGAQLNYYADSSNPYEKVWMNLEGELVERMLDVFALPEIFTAQVNVLDMFLEIHDRFERMTDQNSSDLYAEIYCLLFRILTAATKERFFPAREQKNTLDEKIRAYIDSNVYSDISLDKISEQFGITKMHIIRVFKKKFNITPMQYLIDKKIGIAQSLLTGTVMPIKEIAALLRYSNTQHFSSSFKNAVGCTPNRYRQNGRAEAEAARAAARAARQAEDGENTPILPESDPVLPEE